MCITEKIVRFDSYEDVIDFFDVKDARTERRKIRETAHPKNFINKSDIHKLITGVYSGAVYMERLFTGEWVFTDIYTLMKRREVSSSEAVELNRLLFGAYGLRV